MKLVNGISLILAATLLSACNEQVSPELQNGAASGSGGVSAPPSEYFFKVVDKSEALLNYKLHKTGPSNATVNCEVKSNTALSSDQFRSDQVNNDITCFFEAEELSLYHGGFSFAVQASKNTCDYVAYSPYGYFDRIPGDSSGTYTQITCGNDTTTNANVVAGAAALGVNITTAAGNLRCRQWASNNIANTDRIPFTPTSDQDLCRFNYRDKGSERCDIGVIRINELRITNTINEDGTQTRTEEIIPRDVVCGGQVANCVDGPIKELRPGTTYFTEVSNTIKGEEYEKSYTYGGLMGIKDSNRKYVNYRRDLASPHIDFGTSAGLSGSYLSSWSDTLFGKVFDPKVMDSFSRNLLLDNVTPVILPADLEAYSIGNNTWRAKPLAADPLMSTGTKRVNPFYTFHCLDTALEIKARIRMVVREWDRVFPTNGDLEYLSDLFRGSAARQDAPNYVELPDDNDGLINFNDLRDWDDKIDMDRSFGPFDPASTVWSPTPKPGYPDGWFNPNNFLNNDIDSTQD